MRDYEYKYEIIVYWSEDDEKYIAEVPELAGCMIDGKTKADAVRRIDIAINEWIEIAERLGRNIPEPKNRLSNYRY